MSTHPRPSHEPWFHIGDTWQDKTIESVDIVGAAVADVAVKPTLLQHDDTQVLAYYDASRRLTIADRNVRGFNWNFLRIDSTITWDSHNYVDVGFDPAGRLHIAGNMHASPLQYWIVDLRDPSAVPRRLESLSDPEREQKVTYPTFLRSSDGDLLFTYRDGSSGDGDFFCLRWNEEVARHEPMTSHPLIDGEGKRNAYIDTNAPVLGPDGAWHMLWVWRDSPDAETTHTVNYARSSDLVDWSNANGVPLSSPIVENVSTVIDPVPPRHGLINNNVRLGFLPDGHPLAIYHKRDDSGCQQIWAASFDGLRWSTRQLTEWSFRWDFSGRGSLDFRLEIGQPSTTAHGLLVDVRRGEDVVTFALNEDLSATSLIPASPWSPLRRLQRSDGLYERVTSGRGWAPDDGGEEWFITHRSVPEQRDQQPMGQIPSSQPLMIFGASQSGRESVLH